MKEREIDQAMIEELIEVGTIKDKDSFRKWIYKNFPDRPDNLVCAAIVFEEAVIVKAVMINWRLTEV